MGGKPTTTHHDYPIFRPNSTLPVLVRQVVFSLLPLLTMEGSKTLHNPNPPLTTPPTMTCPGGTSVGGCDSHYTSCVDPS